MAMPLNRREASFERFYLTLVLHDSCRPPLPFPGTNSMRVLPKQTCEGGVILRMNRLWPGNNEAEHVTNTGA